MGLKQLDPRLAKKELKIDKELRELIEKRRAKIKVIGCGGAGNNTLTRLAQLGIQGAETIAVNTDAQDLLYTEADKKILIGKKLTGGFGAGKNPKIGMEAAKETKEELKEALQGADMVFVACGLGGGTGTGCAPVIAEISKTSGALTIAVVTLPFKMEGKEILKNAEEGLANLEKVVDTLIVIPNDRLFELVPDISLITAFKIADEILVNAVTGITHLVTRTGLVNLDFADVKAIMGGGGLSMIGLGESEADDRAVEAVEKALNSPLISVDVKDARGALINVMGGPDMTLRESKQIIEVVAKKLSPDAKIIWGAYIDKELKNTLRALVIVTGVKSPQIFSQKKLWSKEEKKRIEKDLGVDFVS